VPLDPPVRQFWSFTVYDNDTRSLIDNPTQKADLSSRQRIRAMRQAPKRGSRGRRRRLAPAIYQPVHWGAERHDTDA
jgi:hypothetical protein